MTDSSSALAWNLHQDGTLDIDFGTLSLRGAYPVWNDFPLRPVSVEVRLTDASATAVYRCVDGTLTLEVRPAPGGLSITARLEGFARLPSRLMVIGQARVTGAASWIYNGNVRDLPKYAEPPVNDDYGLVNAVVAQSGATLAIGAMDHRMWRVAGRVLSTDEWSSAMALSIGYHLESLPIPAAGVTLPAIEIRAGESPFTTMRAFAREMAKVMDVRQRFDAAPHWGSWYYHYYNFNFAELTNVLKGLEQHPSPGLRAVQIDAGHFTSPGDWLSPNARWPGGLEPAFRAIADAGYLPGIWIAPYLAGNRSKLIADHPDWILRRHDGSPMLGITSYGEHKVWGYPDEVWYILDTSHPQVMAYLRQCFETLHKWGARFFKTDFLYLGFMSPGDDQVKRHTPGLTSVQRMRQMFEMIRDTIGPESFWLGCLAPMAPMIGFADGMRTGGDTGPDWPLDEHAQGHGAGHQVRSSHAVQFVNGILWHNDADALLVRDFHTNLTEAEATTLALWVAILGGAVNTSDPLHQCGESRRELWRFCTPGPEAGEVNLPFWARNGHELLVAVRPFKRFGAWAVLVINPTASQRSQCYKLQDLLGTDKETTESMRAAEWGPARVGESESVELLQITLAPHHHRLLWISPSGSPPPPGLTLGGAMLESTPK
jgi:alpha-galactosidase